MRARCSVARQRALRRHHASGGSSAVHLPVVQPLAVHPPAVQSLAVQLREASVVALGGFTALAFGAALQRSQPQAGAEGLPRKRLWN